MAKKSNFKEFKQGIFKPNNKDKCLNKDPVIFRSSLERSIMIVLDKNDNIISWSSEQVILPYFKKTENRMARYFVDFYWKVKINDVIVEYIVEVKPFKQTQKPTESKNKKQSTVIYETIEYQNNCDKWDAAKNWCKIQKDKHNRTIYFQIITERNIDTILGK